MQTPEVYVPGKIARFGLSLWSTSSTALNALSHPDSFDVVFMRSRIFGTDVLKPRESANRNRYLDILSQGRIWRTEDGPPLDYNFPELNPELPVAKPTRTLDDLYDNGEGNETVRLDGDVRVTQALPPSFRFQHMGYVSDVRFELILILLSTRCEVRFESHSSGVSTLKQQTY